MSPYEFHFGKAKIKCDTAQEALEFLEPCVCAKMLSQIKDAKPRMYWLCPTHEIRSAKGRSGPQLQMEAWIERRELRMDELENSRAEAERQREEIQK